MKILKFMMCTRQLTTQPQQGKLMDMQDEKPDYTDWSDVELAEELQHTEEVIEIWQNSIGSIRKKINRAMSKREDLIDIIKQRGQRKGWQK
jgi:hypothetical protein